MTFFIGVLGVSGSGKTTIIEKLTRALVASARAIAVEPTKAIYNPSVIKRELVPTKLEEIANPELGGGNSPYNP